MICGIDEAGRGSLIGPMVICIIYARSEDIDYLKFLGVRDSKTLTKHKRRALFKKISERFNYRIIKIEPEEIDLYVERYSINFLEVKKISEILNIDRPKEIYIDSFYNNPKLLEDKLRASLKYECKIISENKAEEKYPIVAAASIVAKVIRDNEIENLKRIYGDFGSGYPSDKRTLKFILEYYSKNGFVPKIVRKSWKTIGRIFQKNLLEYFTS